MKEFIAKFVRPGGKITDNVIIAAIFSVLIIFAGSALSEFIFNHTDFKAHATDFLQSENLAEFLQAYLGFFGIWIVVFLVVVIPKGNRRMLKPLGPNKHGNCIKGALIGLALGFAANGICVLISVLKGDISLAYFSFNPAILLIFLFAVFIQSGAEELTDRFYFYQKLRRRYKSPLVAILVNSFVFMALHAFSTGFTAAAASQIVLVGVLFSLFVYYYDGLWIAMFFHTAWNFTQNFLFGLPNSGVVSEYSVFKLQAATGTGGFFYDPVFGIEGSIGASLVLLAIIAVVVFVNRGKGECTDHWAENDQEETLSHAKHAA